MVVGISVVEETGVQEPAPLQVAEGVKYAYSLPASQPTGTPKVGGVNMSDHTQLVCLSVGKWWWPHCWWAQEHVETTLASHIATAVLYYIFFNHTTMLLSIIPADMHDSITTMISSLLICMIQSQPWYHSCWYAWFNHNHDIIPAVHDSITTMTSFERHNLTSFPLICTISGNEMACVCGVVALTARLWVQHSPFLMCWTTLVVKHL